jgi:proteic killer suppression protein
MIKSFADKEMQKVFRREYSEKLPEDIQRRALRKLMAVDFADELRDLRTPPGNRLENLHGEREEQHSIRINRQWRICFEWRDGDAHLVEIVDYH